MTASDPRYLVTVMVQTPDGTGLSRVEHRMPWGEVDPVYEGPDLCIAAMNVARVAMTEALETERRQHIAAEYAE